MSKTDQIGVGALIFDEQDRILLMHRTNNCKIYTDCWFIPCGMVKDGENPRNAIIREMKEEISLDIRVAQEIYNKPNERGILEVAYLCQVKNGIPTIMEPDKCNGLHYFSLNELPNNTGKRTLEVIESYKSTFL